MRYLITPSLHASWDYYQRFEWKEKAEFMATLRKEEIKPSEAMLAGRKFEDDVRNVCDNEGFLESMAEHSDTSYLACVSEVANIVRGGLWQERVMFDARLCGMDFLVFGRMDVIKRDMIYDIKRSESYEVGKYQGSVQHPIYMYGSGVRKFKYLVTDDKSVWHEDYAFAPDMEARMWSELRNMVDAIMSCQDFRLAYLDNWQTLAERKAA